MNSSGGRVRGVTCMLSEKPSEMEILIWNGAKKRMITMYVCMYRPLYSLLLTMQVYKSYCMYFECMEMANTATQFLVHYSPCIMQLLMVVYHLCSIPVHTT